jgi:hypothetical protein
MNVSIRRISAALLAVAAVGLAHAAGPALTRAADLSAAARPAVVPLDYVVTPNGYFHASCVKQLAADDEVAADGSVLRSDGTRQATAACAYPSFGARGERRAAPAASFSGWLANSNTDPSVTPAANELSADWVVPASPAKAAGQTLYFFPGLESVPRTLSILQPVLAWNGYGNAAWTMANWNCCIRGTVYTGPPIPVSPGDQIHGQMVGDCSTGRPCKAWKIVSTDVTTGTTTTMNTKAYTQVFNWYFGGVLEVYGVSTCDQFPANGSITFTNVLAYDTKARLVTPVWSTDISSAAPACGYAVDATTNQTTISFDPTL